MRGSMVEGKSASFAASASKFRRISRTSRSSSEGGGAGEARCSNCLSRVAAAPILPRFRSGIGEEDGEVHLAGVAGPVALLVVHPLDIDRAGSELRIGDRHRRVLAVV